MSDKTLGYIYDARYYRCGEDIYAAGVFDVNVWDRFLGGFDQIKVFGSIYDGTPEQVKGLNKMNHPQVEYIHVPYIDSVPKLLKNLLVSNPIFKEGLKKVDKVVLRVPGQLSLNAFGVSKKINKKVGLEVVGCPWDSYMNYGNIQGKILAPIFYLWMRKTVKNADYVLYVTKYFLQKRYPTKTANVENASNVMISVPDENIVKSKIESITNSYEKKVLTLGIMGSFGVRYKGHEEILKAVAKIKDKIDINIIIEMIGPGDFQWVVDLAKKLNLSENISIKGKLQSGKQVIDWLKKIDLYVHPSKQEGLPRSVIEAMSQACPVLASSVAGIPELIKEEYLHSPGDYKKLADQIVACTGDKKTLFEMVHKNYQNSLQYDSVVLSKKRNQFWKDFSNEA